MQPRHLRCRRESETAGFCGVVFSTHCLHDRDLGIRAQLSCNAIQIAELFVAHGDVYVLSDFSLLVQQAGGSSE
ncbi:MAG: hypothetical protein DMG64_13145 [Acidobacteria bacterium]|nr:MAG: hypothetical protein DMG64_13145 [Acidobacteriota bacterium]